jgi:hypothetical protein
MMACDIVLRMKALKKWDSGVSSVDQFFPKAKLLRREFEERFSDPIRKVKGRFVWDVWNVAGQYSHLRSPLNSLFSQDAISEFLDHLSQWSQEVLGLSSISYPWASAYLDNHYQGLHTDAKHGPWAFVYSLSPPHFSKSFRGGETRVARPQAFATYSASQSQQGPQEEGDFWIDIAPTFNRLTIFDPRRPHCVKAVQGPQDILDSRLVIHGWFSDPRPFFSGKIQHKEASLWIEWLCENAFDLLKERHWSGLLPLRLSNGKHLEILHHQLIDFKTQSPLGSAEEKRFLREIQNRLDTHGPKISQKASSSYKVTLPLEVL